MPDSGPGPVQFLGICPTLLPQVDEMANFLQKCISVGAFEVDPARRTSRRGRLMLFFPWSVEG
jgi:hypothetical protein